MFKSVCRHRHLGGAVRLIGNFDRPNLRFGVRLKAESEKAHQAEVAAVVRTPGKYFKPPIDHAAGSAISQRGPQCGRDDRHGGLRSRALFKRRFLPENAGIWRPNSVKSHSKTEERGRARAFLCFPMGFTFPNGMCLAPKSQFPESSSAIEV